MVLTEGSDVRAFLRFVVAAHVAAVIGVAVGAAGVLLERNGLVACAWIYGFAVYLGAVWIRRRWLKPYIVQPETSIGRWLAGNGPSWAGFERALRHAGELSGSDGRRWVKSSRAVIFGCFALWIASFVVRAVTA